MKHGVTGPLRATAFDGNRKKKEKSKRMTSENTKKRKERIFWTEKAQKHGRRNDARNPPSYAI